VHGLSLFVLEKVLVDPTCACLFLAYPGLFLGKEHQETVGKEHQETVGHRRLGLRQEIEKEQQSRGRESSVS
jgi:hypothetical protein